MKSDGMIERLKALALGGRIRQLDLQFAKLVADGVYQKNLFSDLKH